MAGREIAGDGGFELTIFGSPGAEEYATRQYGKYGRELMVALQQPWRRTSASAPPPSALTHSRGQLPRIGSFRTCRARANRQYHMRAPRNRPRLRGVLAGRNRFPQHRPARFYLDRIWVGLLSEERKNHENCRLVPEHG